MHFILYRAKTMKACVRTKNIDKRYHDGPMKSKIAKHTGFMLQFNPLHLIPCKIILDLSLLLCHHDEVAVQLISGSSVQSQKWSCMPWGRLHLYHTPGPASRSTEYVISQITGRDSGCTRSFLHIQRLQIYEHGIEMDGKRSNDIAFYINPAGGSLPRKPGF